MYHDKKYVFMLFWIYSIWNISEFLWILFMCRTHNTPNVYPNGGKKEHYGSLKNILIPDKIILILDKVSQKDFFLFM